MHIDREMTMRTTIDIPIALLQRAMSNYKVRTKREAVVRALEDRLKSEEQLLRYTRLKGSMPDLRVDLDTLRDRPGR